jgi:hypothetical protein
VLGFWLDEWTPTKEHWEFWSTIFLFASFVQVNSALDVKSLLNENLGGIILGGTQLLNQSLGGIILGGTQLLNQSLGDTQC